MKSIRNLWTATLLTAGALLTAAAGTSIASAADDATSAQPPPPGPAGRHHHGGAWRLLGKLDLNAAQKQLTQRAEVRAQVFKVLTPAQQTQLAALEAEMQAHKHGPGGGPRDE